MKRNKELRKANPASRDERRAAAKERQARMAAGDERYLLPRDKGPVKAYVRDLVDSRRNLLGLFMPLAVLVFVALLVPSPVIQQYATLLCTLLLLAMVVEGFLSGRRIARQAREKFPKETINSRSIGWYAFVRASQIRKLRMPKPRVQPGDNVS
jgi:Flp pilus assembly protein TadB